MKEGRAGQGMWHVWESWEMCTKFSPGNLEGKRPLGMVGVGGRIILKWCLKE
jgi:hypothetical protein